MEVIREVPVEVTRVVDAEVTRQVPVEVTRVIEVAATREVPFPVEVTREVPVDVTRIVERVLEVPVEVTRVVEVEVSRVVTVEVTRQVTVEVSRVVTRDVTVEVTRRVGVIREVQVAVTPTVDEGQSITTEVGVNQGADIDFGGWLCGDNQSASRYVDRGSYSITVSGRGIGSGQTVSVKLQRVGADENTRTWTLTRSGTRVSTSISINSADAGDYRIETWATNRNDCARVVLTAR